jgi:hypothetical protein
VDDTCHERDSQIIDAVLLDEDLERAEPVSVGVPGAGRVEAGGALPLGVREDLVPRQEVDLGVRIDEALDEPRTRDAISPRGAPG